MKHGFLITESNITVMVNNMEAMNLLSYLEGNTYPGRGIICGKTFDNKYAVAAYFIMGRSQNSRNRIFVETVDGIRTKAYDESKLTDPSLIIYSPVRMYKNYTIITNGDQTDTLFNGLSNKKSMEETLRNREYEPDAPNYTPRISSVMEFTDGNYSLYMSILKRDCAKENNCLRYTFAYDNPIPGEARFLHTYESDNNPLPSFEGEPKKVLLPSGDLDEISNKLWNSLNSENKVALYVRFTNLKTGEYSFKITNKLL